jgi:hypothetical protein
MNDQISGRITRIYIRISLLLLILPILYLGFWISISGNEGLTYFEKVQMLMDYFPESLRDPFGIALTFFGLSMGSAIFSYLSYMKSTTEKAGKISLSVCLIAILTSIWVGMSLFR